MLRGKNLLNWTIITLGVLAPVLSMAQTINVDQASLFNRLDRMERRLMALEQKLFAAGPGSVNNTNMGDYELRLQEIERESSTLYGSVEQTASALDRLAKRIDHMSQDIEMRLQDLETKAMQQPMPEPAAAAKPQEPAASEAKEAVAAIMPKAIPDQVRPEKLSIPEDLSPERLYKQAYNYMTAADYEVAQSWLENFLSRFPTHALADNAYYWLGEVHLVQGHADKAVIAFKDGLSNFPQGMKAAGNLLKMGVALQQLGQGHHARSAWKKLLNDFPDSSEAVKAKSFLEQRES